MNSKEIPIIKDENGKPFDIPVDGSLGLLALGHLGLMAWRNKRKEAGFDPVKKKLEMIKEIEKQQKEKETNEKK